MPDKHRLYADQTLENARSWGESVGPNALAIVSYFLESYQNEKQALAAIFSLKNSGRKYTKYEIERACKEIRAISLRSTVKLIQNQLKANKKQDSIEDTVDDEIDNNGSFTRGTAYWEDK